ncbi:MAG: hypothetical protein WEC59_03905 [Salibacteraceae bacterium]
MRKTFTIGLILICQHLIAQPFQSETWINKGVKISLMYYHPQDSAGKVIFAFYSSEAHPLNSEAWMNEILWLGDTVGATLIILENNPKSQLTPESVDLILSKIGTELTWKNTSFMAVENGVESVCGLIKSGLPGVLISPRKTCSVIGVNQTSVYGVISANEQDSALTIIDSLEVAGQWVKSSLLQSEHPYFINDRKAAFTAMFGWVDSVNQMLNDSNLMTGLKTQITSQIPEVVREGKAINVDLFFAENGPFKMSLNNLSGESVSKVETQTGKGNRSFLLPTKGLDWGVYRLEIDAPELFHKYTIIIRG